MKWVRARRFADPGWSRILGRESALWEAARSKTEGGPRILIATSLGGQWAALHVESLLAAALTLRGAKVEFLLCDGVLQACQLCEARAYAQLETFAAEGPQGRLCRGCVASGRAAYDPLGLREFTISENLAPWDLAASMRTAATMPLEEIRGCERDGIPIGEHAYAGAVRFFARGDLENEPTAERVLRRYLDASLVTHAALGRLFAENHYDCAVFHHGIYVPQGIVGAVARRQGVRVVNWNPAYRSRCFIFSHGDTYHHTLLNEPTSVWETIPWDAALEKRVLGYLESRWHGTQDWIWFHDEPSPDLAPLYDAGLDPKKPTIALLTNVVWDAQLHYPANAFPDMLTWIRATVEWFARREGLQLAIRIHPAEVRGTLPSRQRVADEIARAFPQLPRNVFVIPPESSVSTYALAAASNAALIYGTKTGVELAAMGIPVIVAGEAWARGKGFTHDAASAEKYFRGLERLPFENRMAPEAVERARKYAYHFFFRRMIPIECMEPTGGDPPFRMRLRSLEDLKPGRMRGLDVVLDGILNGTPFVYPDEEHAPWGDATPLAVPARAR